MFNNSDTDIQFNEKFGHESLREFADGDLIFAEGDDSREMYIVVEGEVVVTKKSGLGDVTLAHVHRGEFVGEMSLLESLPRSATARAHGTTKLLAIQPGGFLLKIRRDPTFAFEMLQTLSRRIRMTNESLMKELGKSNISKDSLKAIIQGAEFTENKSDGKSDGNPDDTGEAKS
ncbi:MAG: cyclic nucleotide-binding domain-containing protein [Bdellovibrionota bacterium]